MRKEQFGISRGNIKSKQNLNKIARTANRGQQEKSGGWIATKMRATTVCTRDQKVFRACGTLLRERETILFLTIKVSLPIYHTPASRSLHTPNLITLFNSLYLPPLLSSLYFSLPHCLWYVILYPICVMSYSP